ncbi:hypothetical protein EC9_03270 [Rosistilla ulvae]|uniref:Uncharacterized protein n=1 Tax=Rosistilla ulvae TaxID=1930277 RepID=A0A517LU67_9BACT|nr:hypothetical protein [Rosistilla ulvae]QDS86168.1 hypothetical protein EC9_03270 [Rosistilla ulvae]
MATFDERFESETDWRDYINAEILPRFDDEVAKLLAIKDLREAATQSELMLNALADAFLVEAEWWRGTLPGREVIIAQLDLLDVSDDVIGSFHDLIAALSQLAASFDLFRQNGDFRPRDAVRQLPIVQDAIEDWLRWRGQELRRGVSVKAAVKVIDNDDAENLQKQWFGSDDFKNKVIVPIGKSERKGKPQLYDLSEIEKFAAKKHGLSESEKRRYAQRFREVSEIVWVKRCE